MSSFLIGLSDVKKINQNYLINSNMDYWQRGFSTSTSDAYQADRWRVAMTTASPVYSRSTNVPDSRSQFSLQVSGTASAVQGFRVHQRIEDIFARNLAGKTVTLSFWYRFSFTNLDTALNDFIHFTIPSAVNNHSVIEQINIAGFSGVVADNTWRFYSKTFVIPTVSPVNSYPISNGLAIHVRAVRNSAGGSNAVQANFTRFQLEEGSVANDHSLAGGNLVNELALCQRYFEKSYNLEVAPGTASGSGRVEEFRNQTTGITQLGHASFKVMKRANPLIAIYSDFNGALNQVTQDNGSAVAVLPGEPTSIGHYGFRLRWTNGAGRFGCSFHYTADAEI
jgi:hypothetical protein